MAALKTSLLRAVYDWAIGEGHTPHVAVDTRHPGVRVPPGYADATGRIVLNIHPRALAAFELDDGGIAFSARFGGVPQRVEVPLAAVLAIYARENGQGISFPEPEPAGGDDDGGGTPGPEAEGAAGRKRPTLKVVK